MANFDTNEVIITNQGLTATLNASAGGVLIDLDKFVIGNSSNINYLLDSFGNLLLDIDGKPQIDYTLEKERTGLHGDTLYSGFISYVEVISSNSVKFVLDLPSEVPLAGDPLAINDAWNVREVGILVKDSVFFARGVFVNTEQTGFVKNRGIAIRIFAILTVYDTCDLTVINVAVGDSVGLPITPYVYRLPPPPEATITPIVITDLSFNYDYTITNPDVCSPSIALKYGPGNLAWAFIGFDRIYSGNVRVVSDTTGSVCFTLVSSSDNRALLTHIKEGGTESLEYYLVFVVSGTGQGNVRKYVFTPLPDTDTNVGQFCPLNVANSFAALSSNDSYVTIWRKSSFNVVNMMSNILPSRDGIPPNWYLVRGDANVAWSEPERPVIEASFYTPPSRFEIVTRYVSGDGLTRDFDVGVSAPLNPNYWFVAINGITQSRYAYELIDKKLCFSEAPPNATTIEVVIWRRVPTTGSTLTVKKTSYTTGVGSGTVPRSYKITPAPVNPDYVHISLSGIKQFRASYDYTFDAATNSAEFVFLETPRDGLALEATAFLYDESSRDAINTYPETYTYTYLNYDREVSELYLPIVPFDVDYLLVSVSGLNMHKRDYSVIGGVLILGAPVLRGRPITVSVFESKTSVGTPQTSLDGVIVNAGVLSNCLYLLRHNDRPIYLPLPRVNVIGGEGIVVEGCYPDFVIKAQNQTDKKLRQKYSTTFALEDAQEIVFPYRLYYGCDMTAWLSCDFSVRLGPNFEAATGDEMIEYVIGYRTTGITEPPYGRQIRGTGQAGFCSLPKSEYAYSNASVTQIFDLVRANNPTGFIDFVAKMRVRSLTTGTYPVLLSVNFNLLAIPN